MSHFEIFSYLYRGKDDRGNHLPTGGIPHATLPSPPLTRLTAALPACLAALLAAALVALVLATSAQAQLPPPPPQCTTSTCTLRLAPVSGNIVVDGCGDHATLGRFKVILSSSNPNVTPQSFTTVKFLRDRLRMQLCSYADCDSRSACGQQRREAVWPRSSGVRSVIRPI